MIGWLSIKEVYEAMENRWIKQHKSKSKTMLRVAFTGIFFNEK